MLANTRFCRDKGAITDVEVRQLLVELAASTKVARLAGMFDYSPGLAAEYSLDAGFAFMRARLLEGDNAGAFFSPGPFADAGWDCLADGVEFAHNRDLYVRVCQRLCEALDIPPVIMEHVAFTEAEATAARDMGAVPRAMEAMRRHNIPFVPAHWALDPPPPPPCVSTLVETCKAQLVPVG
jgi:hypothetical protein